jgi:hypothetical protein
MKYTLTVFFCMFSAVAVQAQTNAPKGDVPTPPLIQREPIVQDAVPCQRCRDNTRPYPENRWYRRAITDWEQSPIPCRDTDHITLWFIPRPRALIQAICP